MGKTLIWDLSHHQPSSQINWEQAAKEVALAIIRVQYGSTTIDREYKNHVANCKKYGIPFGHYAYGCFVSVNDAKVEANDFYNRGDKDALFWVLDTEKDTVKSCGTKNLAAASQAFLDALKAKGCKTGFYVSHELYKQHGLNGVKADFLWIPRYGCDNGTPQKKPDHTCDLWQYSQYCKVNFYPGLVDLNLLNGDKSLDWFIGGATDVVMSSTPYKVIIPNTAYWQAHSLVMEFEQRGYFCYGVAGKSYAAGQVPEENDPYQFVIETEFKWAKLLVQEFHIRGYDRAYGEANG